MAKSELDRALDTGTLSLIEVLAFKTVQGLIKNTVKNPNSNRAKALKVTLVNLADTIYDGYGIEVPAHDDGTSLDPSANS